MAPDTTQKPAYSTLRFYKEDYPRTLFPLETNRIVVEHGETLIAEYLEGCRVGSRNFFPQHRVHAAKDALHLRRTVKLDPVAEYFIYDLVFRNRQRFRKPHNPVKRHYGYRFENGAPTSPSRDYEAFRIDVVSDNLFDEPFICFDISTYFNSVYHHDLQAWLAALDATEEDVGLFSKFLRETNAGRSVDCLPHGLYPTKMIGNDFLRFVEESMMLKSTSVRRFMDDIYLFGQSQDDVNSDFLHLQRLIGQKGLSVNPAKTSFTRLNTEQFEDNLTDIKKKLLQKRRAIITRSTYDDEGAQKADFSSELSSDEVEAMREIVADGELREEDAELVLTIMRRHTSSVMKLIPEVIKRFPHLAKNVYWFCKEAPEKERVTKILMAALDSSPHFTEYQLFWFAVMLESYLLTTKDAGKLTEKLFNHRNASDISRAKILEIPDLRFGLPDMRQEYLSSGRSDWLSWSSAVGSRTVKRAARNYALEYFMKSSDMNRLIGQVVKDLP